jgi:hypothetical protein
MWQRIMWPGSTSTRAGSVDSQMPLVSRRGHRVWNTQPDGGLAGLGISPVNLMRYRTIPSSLGTAESKASVYGWWGPAKTVSADAYSITRPR